MKKLLVFLFALFAQAAFAAAPITCTALGALGYKYVYFGFTGVSTDVFAMAGSNDAVNWTSISATWPTCGNGTPCRVNSPSAVCYNGYVYLLIAEANDAALNSTFQDIGVLNDDYSVTTLLRFDWSTLGAVSTVFAGRWDKVPGFTNCFVSPVSFTSGYYSWTNYSGCATLTPTSASISSGPTAVTVSGSVNGMYDPQVFAYPTNQSTNCTLVGTETVSGLSYRTTALATGACPNGPFTWQTNALQGNTVLGAETSITTQAEGPNYMQTNVPGQAQVWFENLTAHSLYSSTCNPLPPAQCVWTLPVAWSPTGYRAGTILYFGPSVPFTTLNGGTQNGGTVQ